MSFVVEAALDSPGPRLRVIDKASSAVLLDWDEGVCGPLLASGRLRIEDFRCTRKVELQQLIRKLFLIACQLQCAGRGSDRYLPRAVRVFMVGWPLRGAFQ